MDLFDWIFIISGVIFFISMICALILMANKKMKTVLIVGVILAVLILPIFVILINYIVIGRDLRLKIFLSLILLYLIVEFLLDRVFKFDFRSKPSTHIPYIILEYAACFSFVYGVLALDRTIGWVISLFFWAMLAALIYYIIKRRRNSKQKSV